MIHCKIKIPFFFFFLTIVIVISSDFSDVPDMTVEYMYRSYKATHGECRSLISEGWPFEGGILYTIIHSLSSETMTL